jgi:L-fuconolactonase
MGAHFVHNVRVQTCQRAKSSTMRIDTHQHYWRYSRADYPWIGDGMARLEQDCLPEHVQPLMAQAGFDAAIAVQARQMPDETTALLEFAHHHSFIAGVVGWVDLRAEDLGDQLATLTTYPKLVGVRHVVQDEPDDRFLLRPDFCRGVAMLEEFGLSYDILVHPRHLPIVAEFLSRFPSQRFVLDHLAKPEIRHGRLDEWARALEEVAAFPQLMAKLSGLVTEAAWSEWTTEDLSPYLDVALDVFGPDRLMVGSDWPVCTLAGSYARTMQVFSDYLNGRPTRARDAILGGNAERFWKLT